MNLSIYPYCLKPKISQINSQLNIKNKYGCLLKFSDEQKSIYSDYHSQENFLDYSLFDLKNFFSKNNLNKLEQTAQWQQSVHLSKCMFEDQTKLLSTVTSHYLIQDVQSFDNLKLLQLETLAYNRFKIKMGKSLRAETIALRKLIEKSDYKTKFRLDFNESIAKKEFIIWLEKNKDILQKKIDFIEDPIKWDVNQWLHLQDKYKINLALDMAVDPLRLNVKELPNILVLKPAVQNIEALVDKFTNSDVNFVVTHYMDHPLGQLGANFLAQKLKHNLGDRILQCGLMGFDLFEKHEFSEIQFKNQNFVPTKVFAKPCWGLEFILKKINWIQV